MLPIPLLHSLLAGTGLAKGWLKSIALEPITCITLILQMEFFPMAATPPVNAETGATEAGGAPQNLAEWVALLSDRGMPIFARTAHDIGAITSNSDSTASELAQVVLQDPAMTARLLRIANSPIFNVTGRSISTVSRAVVLLGFDEVRSICLSIAVVETMLKGPQKERVMGDLACSFHAAVQARSYAEQRGDKAPEEVFIATLLYQLGDMAFWTFSGETGVELDAAMRVPGSDPARLQKQHLGFAFSDLTLGLSKEWQLGDLLEHALDKKQSIDPRCGSVVLGHDLARAAQKGWDSPEVKPLLSRMAKELSVSLEDLKERVYSNAEEAIKTASHYGAGSAGSLIPLPGRRQGDAQALDQDADLVAVKYLDPDPTLQLQVLRELSMLMDGKPDLNNLLEMVLEGIYRGIGMDRTLFAMCTPDRRFLKARYALGNDGDVLRRKFNFEISPLKANIFTQVLDSHAPVWVQPPVEPKIKGLLTPAVQGVTEDAPFFVMPIEIMGKAIGVFYADRGSSGRVMDEESYASFRHFGQQANMALTFISSRR